ncbi:MAG TPA: carboxypeptidase regulatory-like domain-containing protein, partial [Saprospiraceae bacterium]|nr:carboxypeptidase regulatory-like domain-containing protein [Saprospiraceae bacterium]
MKQLLLLLLAACTFCLAAVDPKTALTGTVKDAENAKPLIGATIKILKNRELIKATTTNAEGKYRLEIEPGTYDVECSYTGYATRRLTDVQIIAGKEDALDLTLNAGIMLEEVIVSRYTATIQESESTEDTALLSADDASRPAREVEAKESASEARKDASRAKKSEMAAKPTPSTAPKTKVATDAKPAAAGEPPPAAPPASYDFDMKVASKETEYEINHEEVIDIADDKVVTPPPGGPTQPTPRAGLLTAGEWNDLHNWNQHWTALLADGEIDSYQKMYGFFPKHRYTVLLTNEQDFPVSDAVVQLKSNGAVVWEARTDNTGKAELWSDLFSIANDPSPKGMGNLLTAEAWVNGKKYDFNALKPAKDGINFLKINAECNAPKNVDIVWAVDATGSMGDEIEYLKTELLDVINRAKNRNPDLAFRMGTVFYRDQSDAYITKSSGFSADISKTVEFIKKQYAEGGGDYPEAVHSALAEAIFGQTWSSNAIARICFLVLDASPHQSPEVNSI